MGNETRYFFITGTSRSGTTLLQAMLSRGEGVFIPPETHFMPLVWKNRRKLGDIETDAGWNAALQAIRQRTAIAGIELDDSRFEELAANEPRGYGSLLRAWLRAAAEAHEHDASGAPSLIGEKSPPHTMYVPQLLSMFPDAVFVHIVRDPRDVAVSQLQAWGTPITSSAVRWHIDQRAGLAAERMLAADRFLVVRYEDLVARPEVEISKACDVLGIIYRDEMLHPHQRSQLGFAERERHKQRTLEAVTDSRVGRYRGALSPGSIAAIEFVCRRHMRRLGYEPAGSSWWKGAGALVLRCPAMAWRKLRLRSPAHRIARRVGRDPQNPGIRGPAK